MSWASIAKRNTSTTTASSASGPVPVPVSSLQKRPQQHQPQQHQPQQPPPMPTMYVGSIEGIAREDENNIKPECWPIQRPNPKTCSPFITDEARWAWEHGEYVEDSKYSGTMHQTRLAAWREKNNWHLPPNKQELTEFERTLGFYRPHFHESAAANPPIRYTIPNCYDRDINGRANADDALTDLMWCLLHSRSEELARCATVRDFKALFNSVIKLEFPDYNASSTSRHGLHHIVGPEKILWLFSQKANVFPGYRRRGTPRWTKRPDTYPRDASYTKNMVFSIGEGGRDDAGICVVAQMKTAGDDAKIRWLLSAKQMHEMQRVMLVPEGDYFERHCDGWSSDGYGDY